MFGVYFYEDLLSKLAVRNTTKDKVTKWHVVPWQYFQDYGLMLPD
jgi:hypothetical protein